MRRRCNVICSVMGSSLSLACAPPFIPRPACELFLPLEGARSPRVESTPSVLGTFTICELFGLFAAPVVAALLHRGASALVWRTRLAHPLQVRDPSLGRWWDCVRPRTPGAGTPRSWRRPIKSWARDSNVCWTRSTPLRGANRNTGTARRVPQVWKPISLSYFKSRGGKSVRKFSSLVLLSRERWVIQISRSVTHQTGSVPRLLFFDSVRHSFDVWRWNRGGWRGRCNF